MITYRIMQRKYLFILIRCRIIFSKRRSRENICYIDDQGDWNPLSRKDLFFHFQLISSMNPNIMKYIQSRKRRKEGNGWRRRRKVMRCLGKSREKGRRGRLRGRWVGWLLVKCQLPEAMPRNPINSVEQTLCRPFHLQFCHNSLGQAFQKISK